MNPCRIKNEPENAHCENGEKPSRRRYKLRNNGSC